MFKLLSQWDIPNNIDPYCIAVSAQSSRIFISDWRNNCAHIFDLDGAYIGVTNGEPGCNPFNIGWMYVDDASDQLFMTDWSNQCVQVFDLQGQYKRRINTSMRPWDICCSNGGDKIFICGGDYLNSRVEVYDGRSGNKISEHSGVQFGSSMDSIAWNNVTREVFAFDYLNHRMAVLDEDGKFKRSFGIDISYSDYYQQLSVDEVSNMLFITNTSNHCVRVVRCSDGSHVDMIHGAMGDNDAFSVYCDSSSRRVYTISKNCRVRVFSLP